ncbi:MAG: NAD(P)/FAD-dependent oxidoreductase [Planctomycetes bacterium]|nr:NAD(P)/FAD-dependent oxidoreductase [Planctomycetota bacterium]
MIDLLVAGGGPAGLATAILAAEAGLSVTVVEPRAAPIDKACGEGLMPGAVAALAAMSVRPPGVRFGGIRYVDGAASAVGRFRDGQGLGVRRTALHAALSTRARALGVVRVEARVEAVRQDDQGVQAAGLRARWLVAADGLQSPVRRLLRLDLPPRRPARYGVRRHFAVAPWTDLVEVHCAPDAEAYVTPVADDTVGVALLFARPAPGGFEALLARFPRLAERLGPPVTPALGAGPFERRVRRRVAGRVLLVGDAAGYLDPLTGEGVRLGLLQARALVRCLVAGRPQAYEHAWRRLTRRTWLLTDTLLRLRRSPLRRAIVPALRACPRLFDAALDQLAR